MSSRESRAVVRGSAHKRSWSKDVEPPNMSADSPLRILLLGKSVSENSRVGNLILGRSAFDSEAPPDVVERVGGRLKHRHVTLINSPQLLHTHISDDQITQTVRECVSLSDPGPHVVLLLLQHQQCSAEDQERVEKLQDSFSERLLQHTLVLSTQEPTEPNQILQKIIQKCSNRHVSLQTSSSADHLLQAFEDIERSNDGRHLISGDSQCSTVEKRDTQTHSEKLNVLVCGSDGSLKSSISELILQHTHRRSESVRTDVINVLELPALFNTGLSEEEVMRQTLRCVSLCHPGVHAFLLIIPDAPLNNEDRAEMEEIQKIFSSRINKHIMILIMQNSEHQTAELNEETQAVIQSFGGRHHYFSPETQVSTLMENIEKMLEENRGGVYSTETFLEAQMEKYEKMKNKMNSLDKKQQVLMDRVRETEEEMKKLEEEKKRMKMMMDEEQQNQEKERKRREELKREIREGEKHQREMKEEMKRERETFRHEIEEIRREKEKIKREKHKLKAEYDAETDRLMKRNKKDRESYETERQRIEEEFREREERYKRLIKEQKQKEKEMTLKQMHKQEPEERLRSKAVAAGIAGGGFTGGAVVKAVHGPSVTKTALFGAAAVGAIAGGSIGGGAASGTLKGAVGGAVAGAAVVGAAAGAVAGVAVVGAVAGAVVGAVSSLSIRENTALFIVGCLGGAVVGGLVGGTTAGALGGAVVGGVDKRSISGAVDGAAVGAVSGAAVGGAVGGVLAGGFVGNTVAGVVAGGVVGGATSGAVGGAVVCGVTRRSLPATLDGAVAGAAFGVAAGTIVGVTGDNVRLAAVELLQLFEWLGLRL